MSPKSTQSQSQTVPPSSGPSSEWDLASLSASQKVSSSGKDSDTSYVAEDFVLSDEDAGEKRADAMNVIGNIDSKAGHQVIGSFTVDGPNYVK